MIGTFGKFGNQAAAGMSGGRGLPVMAFALAALLSLAPVSGALAQEDGPAPQTGVDPRPKRGIFAETTLGLFTSVGGTQALSNGQPYLGMTVGRDLGDLATIFIALGIGASSASCFDFLVAPPPNRDPAVGTCQAADSFGATYLEGGASYGKELANRLRLSGRLVAGVTQLAPGPIKDTVAKVVPDSLYGFHAGAGIGLDYDTRLDHFAVGFDIIGRFTVAGRPDSGTFNLLTIAFLPRIRYVF